MLKHNHLSHRYFVSRWVSDSPRFRGGGWGGGTVVSSPTFTVWWRSRGIATRVVCRKRRKKKNRVGTTATYGRVPVEAALAGGRGTTSRQDDGNHGNSTLKGRTLARWDAGHKKTIRIIYSNRCRVRTCFAVSNHRSRRAAGTYRHFEAAVAVHLCVVQRCARDLNSRISRPIRRAKGARHLCLVGHV